MNVLLYEHPLSSYAQKVKIVLREKGIAFEAVVPDSFGTERRDDAFAAASPRHEVPALVVDGTAIFESSVICAYAEERWPEPALLPADAAGRAFARMTQSICDTQYEAVNWGWGEVLWFGRAQGVLAETLRAAARRHTAALQEFLAARLGDAPWFGGGQFGLADAAVAPVLNRSVHYGLGPPAGSALAAWHARAAARRAVALTFAEFDAAAARMAQAAHFYASGGRRREYRDHRLDWMIRSGGMEVVQAGMQAGNIRFSWP